MPTRLATRSASKPDDATPRTTRTTSRATVTRGKKLEVENEDEMLAKEMERILRVSEPEPQERTTKSRTTTAVTGKGKAKEVDAVPVKRTVPAASRTTAKAQASTSIAATPTTARKPTVRTAVEPKVAEPAVAPRRTTTSTATKQTKTATSSTVPERRTAAATARITTTRDAGISRPTEPTGSTTIAPTAISSELAKPRTTTSASVKPRTVVSTAKPSTTATSTPRLPSSDSVPAKASTTKTAVTTTSTSSRPTPSSSTIKTSSATASKQPIASSSRLTAPVEAAKAPIISRSTPSSSTRPRISLKGKEKEMDIHELSVEEYPWSDTTTSRPEYGTNAMAAIKASLALLGAAYKAGYQYGKDIDDWTGGRVDKELAVCDAALRVLRGMDEKGDLGSKGLEVEKAAQAVISRSITLGMPRRAFDQLVAARVGILRQYRHSDAAIPKTSVPIALESTQRLNPKWLECCWLPDSLEPKISDQLRVVRVQQLTSAWSCLIGIEGYGYDLPPFEELMPMNAPDGWLNPLQIARLDPPRMHCNSMLGLSRRLTHIPMNAPHWAHVFTVLISGYIVVTTDGETTSPGLPSLRMPSQIWETLKKWLVAYVGHSDLEVAARRATVAARIVSDILDFSEEVIETRQETRQGWFSGKAFMDLLDFWVDVSRKSRIPSNVVRAISLMSGSTSVQKPHFDSAADVDMISTMSSAERDNALTNLFGQFALIETLLTEGTNSAQKTIDEALHAVRWDNFGLAVGGLGNSPAEIERFGKAYRLYARTKNTVVRIHNSSEESARGPSRKYLLEGAFAVEQALTRTTAVDSDEYTAFFTGAVGALNHIINKLPSTFAESETLAIIECGKRLSWLSRDLYNRWECLRSLGAATMFLAHGLHQKHGLNQAAVTVSRQSVDITAAALDSYSQMDKLDPADISTTYTRWWAAFDTLGRSLLVEGDREGAIIVGAQMLASLSPRLVEQLEAADERQTVNTVFTNLGISVERLTFPLCSDVEPIDTDTINKRAAVIFQELKKGRNYSVRVVSLIAERIFESMLLRGIKKEAMELTYIIGKRVLDMLEGDHQAIRRLRILSRLMLLTSSSGTRHADFDQLVGKARSEIAVLQSRPGSNSVLNAEYHAIVLMLQAFQTYQLKDEAAREVINLSIEVIHELRQLLIPPTKSLPTSPNVKKTPASAAGSVRVPAKRGQAIVSNRSVSVSGHPKVAQVVILKKRRSSVVPITEFDDIALLATMLSSLVSLLGLLGDVMAQVDAIKVLRALLRYREDMLNDYVMHSGELASLYSKLGKHTRATNVFAQALRTATDNPKLVTPATLVNLHLRHCDHLASSGEEAHALKAFAAAEDVFLTLTATTAGIYRERLAERNAGLTQVALAHRALATIKLSRDDAAGAIRHRKAIILLSSSCVTATVNLAMEKSTPATKKEDDNPFTVAAPPPEKTGANEPSKDATMASKSTSIHPFTNRYTSAIHWKGAETLIDAYLDLANAYAQRGSAADAKYYFGYAEAVAKAVRSSAVIARSATKSANLRGRMNKLDEAQEKLTLASGSLVVPDGPDAYDLQRVKGDILARQEMNDEANQVFEEASKGIHGLDTVFSAADALLPSPKKEALARVSLSMSTMRSSKEPLLPSTLSQILRRQAWLFREAGLIKESDELYKQVQLLQSVGDSKAEESYLAGKLALDDAFNHFQSDLFMSSLTESTIAMPMGTPGKKVDHRQSTRQRIQVILEQADAAYQSALELVAGSGKVEDVRQACLSLALLRAFQTSLGQGGARVTSFAADLLASSTSIGLHREILEAIEGKFVDIDTNTFAWPTLDGGYLKDSTRSQNKDTDAEEDITTDPALKEYWDGVRTRHTTRSYLSPDGPSYDLSVLPKTWAVVSISVTEDRNTMFISRHQNGHDPLVFCLPLDRQSKREGEEEDVFTFDAGILELKTIIHLSEECSKTSKSISTDEGKAAWWGTKRALDVRMKELVGNVEFCWLGAFKTIFNPRQSLTTQRLELFRSKIEKVFNLALFGTPHDSKKYGKIRLSNSLLECFATLSSKSRDEEIEDFIYFILDIYQFHGVPVAVAELDLDQVGIDVVTALTEMEASYKPIPISPVDGPEHLLLALDKNTQAIPWESMPCLRGRPVSRVPSLPVLLDQVALGNIMQPGSKRRMVNSKKTHFILNPSGDLQVTQSTFEGYLTDMKERAGWKGTIGEKVSELEMSRILKDNDLVLYFGHGGGEQYIRGSKVRTLPKCATTFLWGCSSGKLDDQGDLDPAGTAWNYMMAGCPALTATLWDVTDKDIDRCTTSVYRLLGLDPAHVLQQEKPRAEHSKMGLLPLSNQGMGLSTVEAVNLSREECKMTFLTGAAVVHYGIPVYIY